MSTFFCGYLKADFPKLISVSILTIFAFMLISACSSGSKALERGDYDKAVIQAVSRLKSDTDNEKAISTLKRAYKYALETHLLNIRNLKDSPDPYKWERTVDEYKALNSLFAQIQQCPACRKYVTDPKAFNSELYAANQKAASARYDMAVNALEQKKNRAKAIEAYGHLQRTVAFIPGYKDSEELMNDALFYATLKVLVKRISAPNPAFQFNLDFFTNKLNEYLHRSAINPFVRFYTTEEAQAENLEWVDHQIIIRFDQFSLGNIISNTETIDVSRDSVLLNERSEDEVYGTVKAKFTTYEKSIIGTGLLDFQIFDVNLRKVISQEKFPSEYRWTATWANFRGDERALTDEQLKRVNQKEVAIPNPQFLFEQFAAPLYNQTTRKITDYYRNY